MTFLDGVYLCWTHLDIGVVEPMYVDHGVPRELQQNPE